jgi:hypothetical protein
MRFLPPCSSSRISENPIVITSRFQPDANLTLCTLIATSFLGLATVTARADDTFVYAVPQRVTSWPERHISLSWGIPRYGPIRSLLRALRRQASAPVERSFSGDRRLQRRSPGTGFTGQSHPMVIHLLNLHQHLEDLIHGQCSTLCPDHVYGTSGRTTANPERDVSQPQPGSVCHDSSKHSAGNRSLRYSHCQGRPRFLARTTSELVPGSAQNLPGE